MTNLQINKELLIVKDEIIAKINSTNSSTFTADLGDKWNTAQHAEHLYNSIKPVNQILLAPKFFLRYQWGKPNRKSRTYDELTQRYLEKLQKANFGPVNPFGPKPGVNYSKEKLVDIIDRQYNSLAKKALKWSEVNLEAYLLPHPLLGKITVREMLMFTIYHTSHHLKAM